MRETHSNESLWGLDFLLVLVALRNRLTHLTLLLYIGGMATTTLDLLPADEFAPITLNGEPVVTWRMTHLIEIDGWLYESEYAASEDCRCRRCLLHEDFGGCIVADHQWGLVQFMIGG